MTAPAKRRIITVFCDASFDPSGAAGFGAWAKCEGETQRWSAPLKISVINAAEAEWCAAANAVHLAVIHFHITEWDLLILETDCTEVVFKLRTRMLPEIYAQNTRSSIKQQAYSLIYNSPPTVRAKHVKGHVRLRDATKRHRVNHWTDKAANAARLLHKARVTLEGK